MKCTAIVPAYNEEKTVADVVRTLVASALFQEVIVVSDGSKDSTAQVARDAGARVIEILKNRGKGQAMKVGVENCKTPFVCFFDADLKGLTRAHVALLLDSVIRGVMVMNIGLRDRGRFINIFAPRLPLISGERAMQREIFEAIPEPYLQGFKIEPALNYFCRVNRLPFGTVLLDGVSIVRKMEKVGVVRGLIGYARMIAQIVWTIIQLCFVRKSFLMKVR